MALQLEMTDQYGNTYPQGYRKFAELHIVAIGKYIRLIFNNYRDKAWRDLHEADGFFSQTVYEVHAEPVPAKLDEQGNVVEPPIPGYDDFADPDSQAPGGIGAMVYGYAKTRPDSAGATDVTES